MHKHTFEYFFQENTLFRLTFFLGNILGQNIFFSNFDFDFGVKLRVSMIFMSSTLFLAQFKCLVEFFEKVTISL